MPKNFIEFRENTPNTSYVEPSVCVISDILRARVCIVVSRPIIGYLHLV